MIEDRGGPPLRKCYGSMTIGGHGQVVIPAEARKEMALDVGDKLLVFDAVHGEGLLLIKAEQVGHMVNVMAQHLMSLEDQLSQYIRANEEDKT